MIPIKLQTGFDSHAETDPVTANTTKIITNWKLEVIPQRFFNFSIYLKNDNTKIVTLSYWDKTKELLVEGVLKKNHIVVN